ncbi:MAG: uracil-DNA glycosylase [Caldimicrobium sp.]
MQETFKKAIGAVRQNLKYLEELGFSYIPFSQELKDLYIKEKFFQEDSLSSLFEKIKHCKDCNLHRIRKQPVLEENFENKKLMLIADYPDSEDDYYGRPFAGSLGEILQKMLFSIGLRREVFYITLAVKCKPSAGRVPEDEEIQACQKYLFKEIKLLKPKLILALGFVPPKIFLNEPTHLSSIRGIPYTYKGSTIIFTYHPSYILKNPHVKRLIWEDLKCFKTLYEKIH